MKRILYLAVLGILFAGCTPKTDSAKNGADQPGETPKTAGAATDEPGKPALDTSPTDTPLVSQLPAELKHDGFEYYGLANEQPIEIEVTSAPNGRTLTGTQTTKLVSFAGGKATFRRERTGNLESLGVDEYSLEPTGIYVTSSTVAKTKDRYLEIPAKLEPGKTWQDTTEIE
ncbi:MAG TPA: hypothetical protein VGE01_11685, partial [Fimbriimonas sp.]